MTGLTAESVSPDSCYASVMERTHSEAHLAM